jgi:transcriptional regulator with XRE-family HTH domain
MPEPAGQSQVDALIQRYLNGRTVAEFERDRGLREGAIAHYLKPSQRGRFPRLSVLERIANDLGAELYEVSTAFASDAGLGLDQDPLSPRARRLAEKYEQLDEQRQALVDGIVDLIARQQHDEQSAGER